MTESPDSFGPWRHDLAPIERAARWRVMGALAMVYCGGAHPLLRASVAAERDADMAGTAWTLLMALDPLVRRRLLASLSALSALVDTERREGA